jgi:hypothetical protein
MNRSWMMIICILSAIVFKSAIASNDASQDISPELISDPADVSSSVIKESPQVTVRPLLTFSPNLPIEISPENRQNILENNAQEQKALVYNQEILEQSRIPWIELFAAFLVGSFLLALRYGNTKAKEPEETPHQRVARVRQESLETLDALQQQKSLPQGHYILFYETVSDTIRHYVDEKYQLHTASRTIQEFLQRIESPPVFDQDMQTLLRQLFLKAELVKFAKLPPSLEECKSAELIAREALRE